MFLGRNSRADRTAVRVGLVDLQAAQRSILGNHTNRHGIGAGFASLGYGQRCGGSAINHSDRNRLRSAAFASGGDQGNVLGSHRHDQFIVVAARCKFLCKGAHRSRQTGQVRIVRGQRKEASAVISVVDRAVRAADGADQTVLRVGTGIKNLLQLHAIGSGGSRIDLEERHAAGLAVIGGVAVKLTGFGQIRGGDHDRALGITLQGNLVQIFQCVSIDSKQIAVGRASLHTAAGAHIDLITVHNGGGGCLRGDLVALQIGQSAGGGIHSSGCDVAVLGGEVYAALFHAVSNGGALVAHPGQRDIRDHFAGQTVQCVQMGIPFPTAGAVIGTNDHRITNNHRTGPIMAAQRGLAPYQFAGSSIDTDEVTVFSFTVPIAGIDIAVVISNGGIVLATQRINKTPNGFQRLCMKGFDSATGLGAENQAIAIGGGNNVKTAVALHLVGSQHLTGLQVRLCNRGLTHKNQRIINNDHAAGGIGPAGTLGHDPFGDRSFSGSRRLGIGDGHIVDAVSEIGPVCSGVIGIFPRNKNLSIRRGRGTVAQRPHIPGAAGIQRNGGFAGSIGGHGLGIGVKECPTIENCMFLCGSQRHRQGLVQFRGILVGGFILFIHKIAEACQRLGFEILCSVTGNIHKVAAFQDDSVHRCCKLGTVQVICHIGSRAKQTALNGQVSGCAADSHIVLPLGSEDFLVGVHQQMQRRDIFCAVAVTVIDIVSQAEVGQLDGIFQNLQGYRQVNHRFAFVRACSGGHIVAIQADGNIDRVGFCGQCGSGDHTHHHDQHQQNTQNAFFHVC